MWRVKLPPDYRRFLKEHNGGVPKECEFKGEHSGRVYMVEKFLSIIKAEDYNKLGDRDIDVIHTQLDERSSANEDLIGYYMLPTAHIFAVTCVLSTFASHFSQPLFFIIT